MKINVNSQKNALMGIAISLLPKILQPVDLEDYYDSPPLKKPYIDKPNMWKVYHSEGNYVFGTFYYDNSSRKIGFKEHKPL